MKEYYIEEEATQIPPEREEHFRRYLHDFDLTEGGLKDKKILDVGSGSDPIFMRYCRENNIAEVFALERDKYGKEVRFYYPKHDQEKHRIELNTSNAKDYYTQGDFEEIPFKPDIFDLVLMRAALGSKTDLDKALIQTLSTLKSNGEFRIYPIFRNRKHRKDIDDALSKLDQARFSYKWKEIEEDKYNGPKDLLVLKKKLETPPEL